jgi:hypothetical protein
MDAAEHRHVESGVQLLVADGVPSQQEALEQVHEEVGVV